MFLLCGGTLMFLLCGGGAMPPYRALGFTRLRKQVPGHVGVDCGTAVEEHGDAHYGGRDKQLGVDAQPGKVEADLLSKVLPEVKGHIALGGKG